MKGPKIDGTYVPHTRQLIESPAWRRLSLSARRLLDRIELEHLRHAGKENGRLPVTFDQFFKFGIHRHAIAPAMRECSALGLLEITKQGCAGNAEFRSPNHFRLTYLPCMGTDPPTHEWRAIATMEHAEAFARQARKLRNSCASQSAKNRKFPVKK
jgi:hypothetical protein